MKTASLFIPGRLPTKNEALASARSQGGRYRFNVIKRNNMERIALLARHARIPAFESAHFRFEWIEMNEKRDPDGVTFGASYVLDALQHAGVLPNDGWRQVLSIAHRWWVDKACPGVRVTLLGD